MSSTSACERLAFRDALRGDPALAAEYAALKQGLASLDLPAYTAGQRGFVGQVLAAAGVPLPPANAPVPPGVVTGAALIGQWQVLAAAAPGLDLAAPTRLTGWANAELLAHLAVQPALLVHFLRQPDPGTADVALAVNLAGTRGLAELVDEAARQAAAQGKTDLPAAVESVVPALLALTRTAASPACRGPSR